MWYINYHSCPGIQTESVVVYEAVVDDSFVNSIQTFVSQMVMLSLAIDWCACCLYRFAHCCDHKFACCSELFEFVIFNDSYNTKLVLFYAVRKLVASRCWRSICKVTYFIHLCMICYMLWNSEFWATSGCRSVPASSLPSSRLFLKLKVHFKVCNVVDVNENGAVRIIVILCFRDHPNTLSSSVRQLCSFLKVFCWAQAAWSQTRRQVDAIVFLGWIARLAQGVEHQLRWISPWYCLTVLKVPLNPNSINQLDRVLSELCRWLSGWGLDGSTSMIF